MKYHYFVPNYLADKTHNESELVDPAAIEHGSSMLVDHINTIFHNLYREEKSLRERIELRVTDEAIPKDKLPELYQLIDKKALHLLNEINEWMEANNVEKVPLTETKNVERVGLGVYFIEGENQSQKVKGA